VGVSAYSNFPEEIRELPEIGDAFILDLEQIAILQPTIILAWEDGTPQRVIDELRKLNYRIEVIKTSRLEDIPLAIKNLGDLFDRQSQTKNIIEKYHQEISRLVAIYGAKDSISVFFQIDDRPLFTIGGSHYISQLIELCGGQNIFDELPQMAPSVSIESVILRDPDVILSTNSAGDNKLDLWLRWPAIKASKSHNLYSINADQLERPTTNIIKAGQEICEKLEDSRIKNYSN
jgi:iron complex transport system substrate-binding protein